MRERMERALHASNADYTDVRIEEVVSSRLGLRKEELDYVASFRTVGGIVRALTKGGWGYATFNDVADLEACVQEACESARLVGQEKSGLAPVEPVVDEVTATLEKDFREIPLAGKKALLQEYNQTLLRYHPKICSARAGYGDTFRTVWYANSEGTCIRDEQPYVYLYVSATARDGDDLQHGFENTGGSTGFQLVEGLHQKAEIAAQRAVDLLAASPVRGGMYTAILDPMLAGVFIHEAFGHLSESDAVYEDERMQELMQLGKRVGSDILNVIDDGTLPGGEGTHRYDFEGVRTNKNELVRDGILVGRLHSRETAAKMGEEPTGNARAVGYQHPPIVRMTNTYIEKGNASFEDMIEDVKLGVYAVRGAGGGSMLEMFTFGAAYAYMIRDGQVAELVRDVTLTGNLFETLMNIDMLGDEVEWVPGGPGGCGKGDQSPLHVGMGGPHVRIQNVLVGGRL